MIYLSGCVREDVDGIGFLLTPNSELRWEHWPPPKGLLASRLWAADNGRFAAPAKYTDDGFLAWLDQHDRRNCLFATAPDVLGDHAATLALSLPLLPRIRALGFLPHIIALQFAAKVGGGFLWSLALRPLLAKRAYRDAKVINKLASLGWRTLVIWECELAEPRRVADKVLQFLGSQA